MSSREFVQWAHQTILRQACSRADCERLAAELDATTDSRLALLQRLLTCEEYQYRFRAHSAFPEGHFYFPCAVGRGCGCYPRKDADRSQGEHVRLFPGLLANYDLEWSQKNMPLVLLNPGGALWIEKFDKTLTSRLESKAESDVAPIRKELAAGRDCSDFRFLMSLRYLPCSNSSPSGLLPAILNESSMSLTQSTLPLSWNGNP